MTQSCQTNEAKVIRFEACMDTAACARVEPGVRASLADADGPVVFDLAGVRFISSAFLGLCVRACQTTCGRGFEVINAEPSIKRVFKIAGLEPMLNVR
ncbi:MAG: STAS domain-containing protein [Thermoguttaceae bacterium]